MESILQTFAPSYQNNSKQIAKSLMEKMLEHPNYYYQKQLEKINIGCQWTQNFGEEGSYVEDFYKLDTREFIELSDYEMGLALK